MNLSLVGTEGPTIHISQDSLSEGTTQNQKLEFFSQFVNILNLLRGAIEVHNDYRTLLATEWSPTFWFNS